MSTWTDTTQALSVNVDAIPAELRAYDQWVCWQAEVRENRITKVPYTPTGRPASSTEGNTWSTFEHCLAAYEAGHYDGVGFVLSPDDPFVGIDFDDTTDSGRLALLPSYAETSPSGRGLRCIVKGMKPDGRCRRGDVEVYDQARYLTITGHRLPDAPATIEPVDLRPFWRDAFGDDAGPMQTNHTPAQPVDLDDRALIEKARSARGGAKFDRLWRGDTSDYPTQNGKPDYSAADLALCNLLAFWTGRDAARMDRLFRQSGLMRDKWDEMRGAQTYGSMTIQKAIEDTHETYSPNAPTVQARVGGDGVATFDDTPGMEFWYVDDKGESPTVKIDQSKLVDFLAGRGFRKIYEFGADVSTFVRCTDNVLDRVSKEHIKDYVLRYVESLSGSIERQALAALRRGSNVYFGRGLLECLPVIEGEFQRSTLSEAFFYFANGFVAIRADGAAIKPYSELTGYIWREQIIDRTFEPIAPDEMERAEFGTFMNRTQRGDPARVLALRSAVGYLLHDYKDPACAKAICLLDEKISDVASGRSGKSIVAKGVGHMVPTLHVDARNFSFDTQFAFQSITPTHRVVDFNDASKHFPFDRLFSVITDAMAKEQKGRDQQIIPFSDSPKFIISTNYVLKGHGGSHDDRLFEIEFGDYFNPHHKPTDEFGRRLFDEWDAAEWNRFDNVMIDCVGLYLRSGLMPYRHVNLALKKLASETSEEFAAFVQDRYEANTPERAGDITRRVEYRRNEEMEALEMEFKAELSPHSFTKYAKHYADQLGLEYYDERTTDRRDKQFWFVKR